MVGEKGYTLIEIVLILIILGILGMSFGLNFSGMNRTKIDSAVRKVVADLRYAQQFAMTTQNRHGLTVDTLQEYSVHVDSGGIDTDIPDPTNLGQPFLVNFDTYQQGQFDQVRFDAVTTQFCTNPPGCGTCAVGPGAIIEFNSMGVPTDTNGVPLCYGQVELSQSGSSGVIRIEPITGQITY